MVDNEDNFTYFPEDNKGTVADPTKDDGATYSDEIFELDTEKQVPNRNDLPKESFQERPTANLAQTKQKGAFLEDDKNPFFLITPLHILSSANREAFALYPLNNHLLQFLYDKFGRKEAYLPILFTINGEVIQRGLSSSSQQDILHAIGKKLGVTYSAVSAWMYWRKFGMFDQIKWQREHIPVAHKTSTSSQIIEAKLSAIRYFVEHKHEIFSSYEQKTKALQREKEDGFRVAYKHAQKTEKAIRHLEELQYSRNQIGAGDRHRKAMDPSKRAWTIRSSPKEADFYLTTLRMDPDGKAMPDDKVYLLFPLAKDLVKMETSLLGRIKGFSAFKGPLLFTRSGEYRAYGRDEVVTVGKLTDLARIEGIQEHGNSFSFEVIVKKAHERLASQGLKRYFDRMLMYRLGRKDMGKRFRTKKEIDQLIPRYQAVLLKRPKQVSQTQMQTLVKPAAKKPEQLAEIHPLPGQRQRDARRMREHSRQQEDNSTYHDPIEIAAK